MHGVHGGERRGSRTRSEGLKRFFEFLDSNGQCQLSLHDRSRPPTASVVFKVGPFTNSHWCAMQADSIQSLGASSHAAFGELVHSLATQVTEVRNLCAMRPVAGAMGVDLKPLNQRVVAAEAVVLEMKAFVQEEEDSLARLQVR